MLYLRLVEFKFVLDRLADMICLRVERPVLIVICECSLRTVRSLVLVTLRLIFLNTCRPATRLALSVTLLVLRRIARLDSGILILHLLLLSQSELTLQIFHERGLAALKPTSSAR